MKIEKNEDERDLDSPTTPKAALADTRRIC